VRANVYVDGFNLFYGIRQHARLGVPCKWLDLDRLCRLLLPGDTINRIRYLTALVRSLAHKPHQATNQQTYLRALATIPHLTIHYGHFLQTRRWRPLVSPPLVGPTMAEVWNMEEKGSDVNLAAYLLVDGFDRDYELAVVISNDADLCTPIQLVRQRLGLDVGVLNPHQKPSVELRRVASFMRPIRRGPLTVSQFPMTLQDARGTIVKPAGW
jgi:hypothetical protein